MTVNENDEMKTLTECVSIFIFMCTLAFCFYYKNKHFRTLNEKLKVYKVKLGAVPFLL